MHNVTVLTADSYRKTLAGASRYSSQGLAYPPPQQHPDEFVERIIAIIRQYDVEIVLPMTEITAELLLSATDALPDVILPFPSIDCVNKLSDKCHLIKLAQQLNIPVPESHFANPLDETLEMLANFQYPLVLKPCKSWACLNNRWRRLAVKIANTQSQAQAIIRNDISFQQHPYMLQQCIEGHGAGIFALYQHGKAIAFFAHKRIREKPPQGGVSVLSESIKPDQRMMKYAQTLLDSVNWHGVAMVEFKVADNGTPYLMEVNTRFWGSLQLSIDAGVDFPWLLIQAATKQCNSTIKDYQTGVRLRWLLGDLDNLYLTLRDEQYSFRHKLNTLYNFVLPSLKTRHEINRWHDLAPAWYELRRYIRQIIAK